MRIRSQSDTLSVPTLTCQPAQASRSAGRRLVQGLQRLWRSPTAPPSLDSLQGAPQVTAPLQVSFDQCLEDGRLCEAGRLLIQRENLLYGVVSGPEGQGGGPEGQGGGAEEARLGADRAALEQRVLQAVQQSLSGCSTLPSALQAIQQEEQQDQLWRQRGGTPPAWRPSRWRSLHHAKVRELVEERMEEHLPPPSSPTARQSSIKLDISSMALRLQQDLLVVVEQLKSCYAQEDDICNFYASQYHQVFSSRISSLAQFVLEDSDCAFLLRWVNEYYPGILQKPELRAEINASALGKLLTEELLEPLEQQYLSKQETELRTFMDRVLEEARSKFTDGEEPVMEDGCYVSPVAYDIVQLINGMVTSAEVIMGDLLKAQKITCPLTGLMQRFQSFQADVIRQNRANSRAQVKANLSCVAQFRDVLVRKTHLMPQKLQEDCLSLLDAMKQSAHVYLLSAVHRELKPHYQKLGTRDWLHNGPFVRLLAAVQREGEGLQGSAPSCHQELMGQLHREVTEEYVRRLLRGDVKLKDKQTQLHAAAAVKDDAQKLHNLFSSMGSQQGWLQEILFKIAEVLKLQDIPALQMQVVSLASDHPDLSERHVSALLKLKTNLCKADRRTIKATLVDTLVDGLEGRGLDVQARTFFSRVDVR